MRAWGWVVVGALAVAAVAYLAWPSDPSIAVTSLRYGHGPYPADLLEEGATGDREICWTFYLLELGDRMVLVDTGVGSEEAVRTYRIDDYLAPEAVLAEAGIEARDVDDVILTHTHADHAGGLDRFPQAQVHLQRAAYERLRFADDRMWSMVEAAGRENRLHLLDGAVELWRGVRVEPTGGHTRGSQAVHVAGERPFIIVGDECYFEAACRNAAPLPNEALADPEAHRAFLGRLSGWLKAGARPLTFHDPHPDCVPACVEARVAHH